MPWDEEIPAIDDFNDDPGTTMESHVPNHTPVERWTEDFTAGDASENPTFTITDGKANVIMPSNYDMSDGITGIYDEIIDIKEANQTAGIKYQYRSDGVYDPSGVGTPREPTNAVSRLRMLMRVNAAGTEGYKLVFSQTPLIGENESYTATLTFQIFPFSGLPPGASGRIQLYTDKDLTVELSASGTYTHPTGGEMPYFMLSGIEHQIKVTIDGYMLRLDMPQPYHTPLWGDLRYSDNVVGGQPVVDVTDLADDRLLNSYCGFGFEVAVDEDHANQLLDDNVFGVEQFFSNGLWTPEAFIGLQEEIETA